MKTLIENIMNNELADANDQLDEVLHSKAVTSISEMKTGVLQKFGFTPIVEEKDDDKEEKESESKDKEKDDDKEEKDDDKEEKESDDDDE